ncbi:hypothetical protein EJ03DRAFT_125805 [Teratosphaeria nubilosa]|uniref:Uncharacterized protein n=1 Tax=Teratosphaeria nubilosa TaxID=161662 RepID=A0A6G1LKB6_9PEZI|nr:hypothetical protein EJ03DRAFT_125805 [Teratosphaeria nubilosa]
MSLIAFHKNKPSTKDAHPPFIACTCISSLRNIWDCWRTLCGIRPRRRCKHAVKTRPMGECQAYISGNIWVTIHDCYGDHGHHCRCGTYIDKQGFERLGCFKHGDSKQPPCGKSNP